MSLVVDNLCASYGRSQVLFGASLEVPDGALVCLMGRNGVGKSTLLHAIMGVMGVRSGRVVFDGVDVTTTDSYRRARAGIGYVPQGHSVFPQLTTRENLVVVAERAGHVSPGAIDEAVDVFPALATLMSRPAGLLSGGQAKQLAIARALVTRPTLLMLDEPTEGIQPSIIGEIEDAIAVLHRDRSMSVLLVEQYVEFALRLAERFAVMEGGRITHAGDTASADLSLLSELVAI